MTPERPSTPARRSPRNVAREKTPKSRDRLVTSPRAVPSDQATEDEQATRNPVPNASGKGPARGYSWQPFQPGHRLSVKAGANSPSIVAERVAEVHAHLLTVAPYLDVDVFLPQVNRYLRAAAIESLLDDYVVAKGIEACAPRMIEQLHTARRLARDMAIELGLSPRGRAELATLIFGAERAEQDIADLRAEGAAIRKAHEPRLAVVPDQKGTDHDHES